jgi:hypothetical protein
MVLGTVHFICYTVGKWYSLQCNPYVLNYLRNLATRITPHGLRTYYDRSAREREFAVSDFVYLYNPAIKVGVSAKFRRPCVEPWRITEEIPVELRDSRTAWEAVHVNRLKRAYDPVDWQGTPRGKPEKRIRPKRRQQEEEQEMPSPGPISIRAPRVENSPQAPRSPVRNRKGLDTPTTGPSPREPPSDRRTDPTYAPSDTPRSRRELGTTRENPPLTRLRSRMQTLPDAFEEGQDE